MKNIALIVLSILLFTSCENFDDPIPDGSVLETPTLSTQLVESGKVQLTWTSAQICAGYCPSIAPATFYEIWTKSLTSTTNYKLDETQAGQMSYLVEGLEPGVKQEFYVIARRANVSNKTNRVMVVPNELPASTTVFEKDGFDYITHPQVSPDGSQVVYSVSESGSFSSPQQIFTYNFQSKLHKLVAENGQFPSWSAGGDRIVYVNNDANSSVVNEYSLATNAETEIVSDSFQNYFPIYVSADTTLIYFLDSLEEGDQSIISFNLDEVATNPKRSLRDVDDIENIHSPMLGMNYSVEENSVAYSVTFPNDTEIGYSYDVVGFALGSPSALKDYVISDWNDSNPSFSPSNPDLLAFISDRSGVAQVWIKNISTQQLIQVTDFQESEWINVGIVGLNWNEEDLYVNIMEGSGVTRLVRIDISELLEN